MGGIPFTQDCESRGGILTISLTCSEYVGYLDLMQKIFCVRVIGSVLLQCKDGYIFSQAGQAKGWGQGETRTYNVSETSGLKFVLTI